MKGAELRIAARCDMEQIFKRAWAEIHLDRLRENFNKLSELIEPPTEIMAVVKANGYGHDDIAVAKCLEDCGVKYFAVSNLHEAISLRENGVGGDILILSYTPAEYVRELSRFGITQAVVAPEHADELSEAAAAAGVSVKCHIKLDTGMHRVGMRTDDASECADEAERIIRMDGLEVDGMFTHFSVADSGDEDDTAYTDRQQSRFFEIYDLLCSRGIKLRHAHCLNSAGAAYHFDGRNTLARFGIMLYGLYPNYPYPMPVDLTPVMELKAAVSQVKLLKKGEQVSYGRRFTAERDMKTAIIPIGYADGYPRLLSSIGEAEFRGRRYGVIGNICMDQLILDVSGCEDIRCGDVVTLMGADITADELAQKCGTIGYEIICGISKRVPRVITDNGKIVKILEY